MVPENSTGLKKTDLIHNDKLREAIQPGYDFEEGTNDSFLRSTSAASEWALSLNWGLPVYCDIRLDE
jgi:hypothetical protein